MTNRKEKIESFLRELIVNVMRSADVSGTVLTLLPTTSDNIARVKNAIEPTIESFSKFYLDDEGNWKPEVFGEVSKPEPKSDLGEVVAELVLRVSKLEQERNNVSLTEDSVIKNEDQFSCFEQTHVGNLFEDFFKEAFKDFFKQRAEKDDLIIEKTTIIPPMIYAGEMYLGTTKFGEYIVHLSYLNTSRVTVVYQCAVRDNKEILVCRDALNSYSDPVQVKLRNAFRRVGIKV